jgi:NADH:ubiquinone oxidoreductase subunit D
MAEIRNYTIIFGPQHPAYRGRGPSVPDGEGLERADPVGLLHRATKSWPSKT